MGKGLAQRRRLKRALEAARGNLHNIANGKSLPLGHGLPEAPKPEDANKLPRSLRKILAVKEAIQAKEGKPTAATEAPQEWKRKDKGRPREAGAQAGDGPSTSGRDESEGGSAAEWKKNKKKKQGEEQEEQQQAKHKGGAKGPGGVKGNPFLEQAASKSLKAKKKEYLKRKAEGKRKRGGKDELVVEKELQLRDKVKFGEVVDAPLQVHLKRKHWAGQEKSASERCKEVFLKQMQQAQQRMGPAAGAAGVAGAGAGAGRRLRDEGVAVGGAAAGTGKKAGKKDAGGKGQAKQQQQKQQQQQQQDKKGKKRKAPMDEETEALRQQLIESYRMAKKGGSMHTASVGNATLASLAKLTGKGKAAAAAGTYTLA